MVACAVSWPGLACSLAQANLVTLLAYSYSAGLVGADLLYSFLAHLQARFDEADVSAMVTLLNAVRGQRGAGTALISYHHANAHLRRMAMLRSTNVDVHG